MNLLNFKDFLNEGLGELNESLKRGDAYLVGDFGSILLGSTRELKNEVKPLEYLAIPRYIKKDKGEKGGEEFREIKLDTYLFSEILKDYKKDHPETKFVFLFMGAGDLYEFDSNTIRYAREVRKEMIRIFPNAQRFIVSAGSWGWENLNVYGDSSNIPSEILKYYESVWKPLGFIFLKEYLGVQYDENNNPIAPNSENKQIGRLSKEILEIAEGEREFYTEDVKSIRDLSSIEMDEEGKLINFYDVLQSAIHEGLEISKDLSYTFNPVVERAQIGLKFLGYELSKFGIDGIFSPEVEEAVRKYKSDYLVEGDSNVMDDYFFISLINNLKNKGFRGINIDEIIGQSYSEIDDLENQQGISSPSYSFSGDLGGDEYLIFVQHNQGVAGAASLVNAKYGKGEIHSFTRSKGMVNNIPSDMPDYRKQILEALSSGNDQRAASLFLEMWKIKYAAKKQQGMKLINTPEYSNIKAILERVSGETGVPFDTLVAIATIESGLNPNVGNSTYKGLFALNASTAVKYNPAINQSNVHDPVINAEAAGKMLASGKSELAKSLQRSGVISNLDFA
jgi:peptidoglycan hydrolase-like protein with peptidoglycan-binding domain